MDVERILRTLSQHGVDYILIGGMNFLINHSGPLTYDVDVFVRDTPENLRELNFALQELACEWGRGTEDWKRVPDDPRWLETQAVYCLASPHGAFDIFRAVKGLEDGFDACLARAQIRSLKDGEMYYSLSDEDMLRCQEALPESERKKGRVEVLRRAIEKRKNNA
ncbi:MAG TPA: hypothetical protein VKX17_23375 [Planctomycetota bacterium]|nr:hypothetical protein [Planctomycetota bacterium]